MTYICFRVHSPVPGSTVAGEAHTCHRLIFRTLLDFWVRGERFLEVYSGDSIDSRNAVCRWLGRAGGVGMGYINQKSAKVGGLGNSIFL